MECDNPGIGNSQLMGTMDEVKFLRNRRNSLVTLRAEITSSEKAHTVEETRAEQDRQTLTFRAIGSHGSAIYMRAIEFGTTGGFATTTQSVMRAG